MAALEDVAVRFAEACALAERGHTDQARQAYLEILAHAPDHVGALNNFGTLLYETGFRSAARTAYAQAVTVHPEDPTSQVNLGNLLLAEGKIAEAQAHFTAALHVSPNHAEAHRGLAYCLDEIGDAAGAKSHRDTAFTGRALTHLPFRGTGTAIPVLVLVAARGGNIPTRFLLDDRIFATTVAVADYLDPRQPLPDHRLIFNTIGDADLVGDALLATQTIVARSTKPVINPPERIMGTGRADIARRLATIPGLRVPRITTLPRKHLEGPAEAIEMSERGLSFPLLVRAPGFHTGRHFVRVERADDLATAVASLPGPILSVIEYLDARGSDGRWRKYRAMMIEGRLYPLHLAVSESWKVHYFTAAMADEPAFRAEEAAFLDDMAGVLGPKAMAALDAIVDALGLDYGGIDFGRAPDGTVLLFEANATMVINPPEPDPRWNYRRAPIQRTLDAVRSMLLARAGNLSVDRTES